MSHTLRSSLSPNHVIHECVVLICSTDLLIVIHFSGTVLFRGSVGERRSLHKSGCARWSFAVSFLLLKLALHLERLWCSPRRWPRAATIPVQIR